MEATSRAKPWFASIIDSTLQANIQPCARHAKRVENTFGSENAFRTSVSCDLQRGLSILVWAVRSSFGIQQLLDTLVLPVSAMFYHRSDMIQQGELWNPEEMQGFLWIPKDLWSLK